MRRDKVTEALWRGLGVTSGKRNILANPLSGGPSIDNIPSAISLSTANDTDGSVGGQIAQLSTQLNQLQSAQESQLLKLAQGAEASSASSNSGGGASIGGTLAGLASSLLGGGLGVSSLIGGIAGLFGGGGNEQIPLIPYTLPGSIQYIGGVNRTSNGVVPLDYGQNGNVRPVASGAGSAPGAGTPGSNVQITVNTMDSKSFMDNSDLIAQAVRQALLNSSTLNDVISSL